MNLYLPVYFYNISKCKTVLKWYILFVNVGHYISRTDQDVFKLEINFKNWHLLPGICTRKLQLHYLWESPVLLNPKQQQKPFSVEKDEISSTIHNYWWQLIKMKLIRYERVKPYSLSKKAKTTFVIDRKWYMFKCMIFKKLIWGLSEHHS